MSYWQCIIGLGNPGPLYANTRHNVGFLFLDHLIHNHAGQWLPYAPHPFFQSVALNRPSPVLLVRPLTYMNRSGLALTTFLKESAVPLDRCLVVYDDFQLPLGRARLRLSGSHGGHNGLRDILRQCDTADVPRLRFGIGQGQESREKLTNPVDFVLGNFLNDEAHHLHSTFNAVMDGVGAFLQGRCDHAMAQINGLLVQPPVAR